MPRAQAKPKPLSRLLPPSAKKKAKARRPEERVLATGLPSDGLEMKFSPTEGTAQLCWLEMKTPNLRETVFVDLDIARRLHAELGAILEQADAELAGLEWEPDEVLEPEPAVEQTPAPPKATIAATGIDLRTHMDLVAAACRLADEWHAKVTVAVHAQDDTPLATILAGHDGETGP